MASHDKSSFFSRLPAAKLTATELKLRDLLLEAATTARQLLPRSGAVSVQEWVERRIPGEVLLGIDVEGHVYLAPPTEDAPQPAPPATPPPRGQAPLPTGPCGKGAGGRGASQSSKTFLDNLPADNFLPEEEILRKAVTEQLARGPQPLEHVTNSYQVAPVAAAFLPRGMPLSEWIEERIGGEVIFKTEKEDGQVWCMLAKKPQQASNVSKETWFEQLPDNSFTDVEERLRLAIYEFLAGWTSDDLATLSHCGSDKGVSLAKRDLPKNVTIREWIERRIGGEIELRENSKSQHVVHLTPDGFKELQRLGHQRMAAVASQMYPPDMMYAAKGKGKMPDPPAGGGKGFRKEDWLAGLPPDGFLPQEEQLRQALLRHIEDRSSWNKGNCTFRSAIDNNEIKDIRKAFFPKGVKLEDWIDHRVGGEMMTFWNKGSDGKNNEMFIKLKKGGQGKKETRRGGRRGHGVGEDAPDGEGENEAPVDDAPKDPKAAKDEKREKFFAQLPEDGFTDEEERLREAIIDQIMAWDPSKGPITLGDLGNMSEIKKARDGLMPKGVTMRTWIDRRIGGEVETAEVQNDIVIGMRGELDVEAAREALSQKKNQKRKAPRDADDEPAGKSARG